MDEKQQKIADVLFELGMDEQLIQYMTHMKKDNIFEKENE